MTFVVFLPSPEADAYKAIPVPADMSHYDIDKLVQAQATNGFRVNWYQSVAAQNEDEAIVEAIMGGYQYEGVPSAENRRKPYTEKQLQCALNVFLWFSFYRFEESDFEADDGTIFENLLSRSIAEKPLDDTIDELVGQTTHPISKVQMKHFAVILTLYMMADAGLLPLNDRIEPSIHLSTHNRGGQDYVQDALHRANRDAEYKIVGKRLPGIDMWLYDDGEIIFNGLNIARIYKALDYQDKPYLPYIQKQHAEVQAYLKDGGSYQFPGMSPFKMKQVQAGEGFAVGNGPKRLILLPGDWIAYNRSPNSHEERQYHKYSTADIESMIKEGILLTEADPEFVSDQALRNNESKRGDMMRRYTLGDAFGGLLNKFVKNPDRCN